MKLNHNRIAVIFNPMGGSAKSGMIDKLATACAVHGIELVKVTTTADFGSARKLAGEAVQAGTYDAVIACGGDGTACQVAEGLMGSGTPLAVFPAGTGNLFARAFYASPVPARFIDMIVHGQPQPLDMVRLTCTDTSGKEHQQLFLVATGFGKISDAISFASARMKRIFGKFAYVARVAVACVKPAPVRYSITPLAADGSDSLQQRPLHYTASAVFAFNAVPPSMLVMSRGCNASDGLLDVVAITANRLGSLLQVCTRMVTGRPDLSTHYRRVRAASVRIDTSAPVTPNIDGDPGVATQSLLLTVLPQAVQIIVS